jgi:membrane-associated protease RseP (regulator of RpoE activity)
LVSTADGKVWVSNLAYQASAEANIDAPAKAVDLAVTKTGDAKTVWLALKGQKLAADEIYTIIVSGLTGANKTDKTVKLAAIILTSKSIAGFAPPPTPTPVATAAATKAAPAAATVSATTAATKSASTAATMAATVAATATVNPTAIPAGQQPASAGVALRTSKLVHLNDGKCVEVAGITVPGGPAAVAGLKAGDIILGVDGKALATAADFEKILAKHKSGDVITLAVQAAGTTTESDVKVTLGLNPFS